MIGLVSSFRVELDEDLIQEIIRIGKLLKEEKFSQANNVLSDSIEDTTQSTTTRVSATTVKKKKLMMENEINVVQPRIEQTNKEVKSTVDNIGAVESTAEEIKEGFRQKELNANQPALFQVNENGNSITTTTIVPENINKNEKALVTKAKNFKRLRRAVKKACKNYVNKTVCLEEILEFLSTGQ